MKRNVNFITLKGFLSFFIISLLITSIMWILTLIVDGPGYGELKDVLILIIASSVMIPTLFLSLSPKGEIIIDQDEDQALIVTFISKNLIFKRKKRKTIKIDDGQNFTVDFFRSGKYDVIYTLSTDTLSIDWKVMGGNVTLRQDLVNLFNNFAIEPKKVGSLQNQCFIDCHYSSDIELEPVKKLKRRTTIRKIGKFLIITAVVIFILSNLLKEIKMLVWEHQQQQKIEELAELAKSSDIDLQALLNE